MEAEVEGRRSGLQQASDHQILQAMDTNGNEHLDADQSHECPCTSTEENTILGENLDCTYNCYDMYGHSKKVSQHTLTGTDPKWVVRR